MGDKRRQVVDPPGSKRQTYTFKRRCFKVAVPKRKVSKARRDKRRSSVWKLEAPTLVKCDQCGGLKLPHKVCGNCGYYKGRSIVKKEA